MSSQYSGLVFIVDVVQRYFVFVRFKRTKYIRSKTINEINSRQYVTKLE